MSELDECCGPHWERACAAGELDGRDSWECPDCGCEWVAQTVNGAVRMWEPRPVVLVFR